MRCHKVRVSGRKLQRTFLPRARQPEQGEERLPVSLSMRIALAISGLATLYIGLLPNSFINMVNWALGLAQNPSVAKLTH